MKFELHEIEPQILIHCFKNHLFFVKIKDYINEDYFTNTNLSKIFSTLKNYHNKYNNFPTMETLKALFRKFYKDKAADFLPIIDSIYNFQGDYNGEYIEDQTINFLKQAKIIEAIKESYPLLDNPDEYDGIADRINKAININLDKQLGLEFKTQALSIAVEAHKSKILTGYPTIDLQLNGGLEGGCVYVFSGVYGTGKSIWLHNIATNLLLNNKYIVLYSLELSEQQVARRLISNYAQIKQADFLIRQTDLNKQFELLKQLTKTDIIIKQYPVGSATSNTFRQHLSELKQIKGIHPDILVVDYATIMKVMHSNKNDNDYSRVKKIYEELRALAQELNIPIVTAAQINRGGMDGGKGGTKEMVTGANISDSLGINMTVDFQAIINQTLDDKINNIIKLYIDKNRFGKSNNMIPFTVDYDFLTVKESLISGQI